MSEKSSNLRTPPDLPLKRGEATHWVEIFARRTAEDLKRILQEDMDWTTSVPILERLDRLYELEEARRRADDTRNDLHSSYRLAS
ncbi:MAG: hypothetical protein JSR78_00380 [Proteobacteria bacterium]|nr:hypothetical protein [Pseudomonadota bacterium]